MRTPTKMAVAVVASTTMLLGFAATSSVASAETVAAGITTARATGLADVTMSGRTLTWRHPDAANAKKVRFSVQAKPVSGGKTRTLPVKGATIQGDTVTWELPWEASGAVKVRADVAKKKGRKTVWTKGGWVKATDAPTGACINDQLTIGTLLPETGNLSFIGPSQFAAVDMAIADINAGGGVLGSPAAHRKGDSGDTTTDTAAKTVKGHQANGVGAIIGASSSGVSLTVLDQVVAGGMAMISPSNTATVFTDYADKGLYFRVVASDALESVALAQHAAGAGLERGVVLARKGGYGEALASTFDARLGSLGGTVTDTVIYDPSALDAAALAKTVEAADAQFIYIAGFDETRTIIDALIAQGVGPQDVQIYMPDGGLSVRAYQDLPDGTMDGVIAAVPTGDPDVDLNAFVKRLQSFDPSLRGFSYAAQAYDSTMLAALAAQYAGCGDGSAIAKALPVITNGGAGTTECATWETCNAIIAKGGIPNYEGQTGPLEFDRHGDMARGFVDLVEYVNNTQIHSIEVVKVSSTF